MLTVVERGGKLAERVRAKEAALIRSLTARVRALPREVRIELCTSELAKALALELPSHAPGTLALTSAVRLTRTGRAVRLVHANGKAATAGTPDAALVRLLFQARRWWAHLAEGEIDCARPARSESVTSSYVSRVIRLNFLAPELIDAILNGTHPAALTAARLKRADLPMGWNRQVQIYWVV